MKRVSFFIFIFALAPMTFVHSKPVTTGSFMVVKGDVKVLRANSETLKAKVGATVLPGDTIIAASESRAKIMMEDRNVIHISPNTELKIEKYVNDGQQKNVELNLKEGKVRNNVEQVYDGEKNKFIIKTPTAVAGVRGTQFITSFDKASNQTRVFTLTGKVELTNRPSSPGIPVSTVIVSKGETSEASATQPPATPQPVAPEQLKQIEMDSTSSNKESSDLKKENKNASENDFNNESKKQKKRNERGTASSAPPRIEDKQDQSIQTFDKLPETQQAVIPTTGTPPPVFQPPPPTVNNLSGDAIRQQNEKAKVKISPRLSP